MEWITDKPPDNNGYYLGAWKTNNPYMYEIIVSELWFNPDANPKWWFSRGYTGQPRNGGNRDAVAGIVLAWMPMPDPPKDLVV